MNALQYAYINALRYAPCSPQITMLVVHYAYCVDPAVAETFKKILYDYRASRNYLDDGPDMFHLCTWLSHHHRVNANFNTLWDITCQAFHAAVLLIGYTPDLPDDMPFVRHACARFRTVRTVSARTCRLYDVHPADIIRDVGPFLWHVTAVLSYKGLERVHEQLPVGVAMVAEDVAPHCIEAGLCALLLRRCSAVYLPLTDAVVAAMHAFLDSDKGDSLHVHRTPDPISFVLHFCVTQWPTISPRKAAPSCPQ